MIVVVSALCGGRLVGGADDGIIMSVPLTYTILCVLGVNRLIR